MRTAIQLYTLRSLDEPLTATLERVGRTSLDGVEFAGLGRQDPSTLATLPDELDLEAVGAHVSLADLEESYDRTVDTYDKLGCPRLVVPSYAAEAFESREGVDEAAARLSTVGERLADDGFECHYHTHHFEFEPLGDGTAFDRLAARTAGAVAFELDTGLARHAGADPAALLDEYGERVSLVHLTDAPADPQGSLHADPGTGIVDLAGCAAAARGAGAEWLIGEHGGSTAPLETLERIDATLATLSAP